MSAASNSFGQFVFYYARALLFSFCGGQTPPRLARRIASPNIAFNRRAYSNEGKDCLPYYFPVWRPLLRSPPSPSPSPRRDVISEIAMRASGLVSVSTGAHALVHVRTHARTHTHRRACGFLSSRAPPRRLFTRIIRARFAREPSSFPSRASEENGYYDARLRPRKRRARADDAPSVRARKIETLA